MREGQSKRQWLTLQALRISWSEPTDIENLCKLLFGVHYHGLMFRLSNRRLEVLREAISQEVSIAFEEGQHQRIELAD